MSAGPWAVLQKPGFFGHLSAASLMFGDVQFRCEFYINAASDSLQLILYTSTFPLAL